MLNSSNLNAVMHKVAIQSLVRKSSSQIVTIYVLFWVSKSGNEISSENYGKLFCEIFGWNRVEANKTDF